MQKQLSVIFFLLLSFRVFAQQGDTLQATMQNGGLEIQVKALPGDNVSILAQRFHVPLAIFADYNHLSTASEVKAGGSYYVPLSTYNLLGSKPASGTFRAVYFVAGAEPLYKIASALHVPQRQLMEMNKLQTNELRRGQKLMLGWLSLDLSASPVTNRRGSGINVHQEYDPLDNRRPATETIIIRMPDTTALAADTLSEGALKYLEQTSDGAMAAEEKGTAVFFKRAGRSENGIYFALHNTAKRGTIVRIYNPGTDKTVYAKVIGTIPTRDVFYNALIALSSDARTDLGTGSEKMWCEISYAP